LGVSEKEGKTLKEARNSVKKEVQNAYSKIKPLKPLGWEMGYALWLQVGDTEISVRKQRRRFVGRTSVLRRPQSHVPTQEL